MKLKSFFSITNHSNNNSQSTNGLTSRQTKLNLFPNESVKDTFSKKVHGKSCLKEFTEKRHCKNFTSIRPSELIIFFYFN